jgi:hypothetical protein
LNKGRLSKGEIAFIDSSLDSMSDSEIAEQIGRSVEAVAQRRGDRPQRVANTEAEDFIAQLHQKHYWPKVKRSLLDEEVSEFEQGWAALYAQFVHQGVTETDETMMKDLCIEDILLHRVLEEKRRIIEEIKEKNAFIDQEKQKPFDERDNDAMTMSHRTVVNLRGAQEAYTKEINDIKKTKDNKFKDLKATRQERLKVVEEAGKNIFALIKLLDEQDKRDIEGRMTGLVYESARRKREEFEKPRVFADGEIDRPWLTPESELEYGEQQVDDTTEADSVEETSQTGKEKEE